MLTKTLLAELAARAGAGAGAGADVGWGWTWHGRMGGMHQYDACPGGLLTLLTGVCRIAEEERRQWSSGGCRVQVQVGGHLMPP